MSARASKRRRRTRPDASNFDGADVRHYFGPEGTSITTRILDRLEEERVKKLPKPRAPVTIRKFSWEQQP